MNFVELLKISIFSSARVLWRHILSTFMVAWKSRLALRHHRRIQNDPKGIINSIKKFLLDFFIHEKRHQREVPLTRRFTFSYIVCTLQWFFSSLRCKAMKLLLAQQTMTFIIKFLIKNLNGCGKFLIFLKSHKVFKFYLSTFHHVRL